MFYGKYFVNKEIIRTKFGSICIENVRFNPNDLQEALPQIVFEEENLKFTFSETDLDNFKSLNIFKRFIPKSAPRELTKDYISNSISSNHNFYSFLAEGILGLVYRDLYNYQLSKGLIDVLDTENDTHTGVDACMYDTENNVIILGEAKFFDSLNAGINKIINDFTKKNIKNKIENLERAVENSRTANKIVIKNIEKQNYEEYSLEEFLNQKLVFAGFVLHSAANVDNYSSESFYDGYDIDSKKLKANIEKSLDIGEIEADYNIVIVHLPVKDKKELIIKIIETAKEKAKEQVKELRGEKIG